MQMVSQVVLVILQMILAMSTDASSWNRLDSRYKVSLLNIVESHLQPRPDVISSKISFFHQRKNLNLRGGGIPFEDADRPAVNDYNEEEDEAFMEERGTDPRGMIPEGSPAYHKRSAAQVEQLKEQSRSSLGYRLFI
jgi:hypothetical protein